MNRNFQTTATLACDIAQEEAADACDALSNEVLELRKEVEALRREGRGAQTRHAHGASGGLREARG